MKNCEFLGVYIEDEDAIEYRIGYRLANGDYKPIIEKKIDNNWKEINQRRSTGSARALCTKLRKILPFSISFSDDEHTQNQRSELINQVIYNLSRLLTSGGNFGGAHT